MTDVLHGSYTEMLAKIEYRKGNTSRKIANNTSARIEWIDPAGFAGYAAVIVRLHNTDILTIRQDDSIELRANGWLTPTTKQRMNEFLHLINWTLYADRGAWYACRVPFTFDRNSDRFKFADGMRLFSDGTVQGAGIDTSRADRKRKAQIKKFSAEYMQAFAAGAVPFVSAGDCFYCHMVDVETGKPLPDVAHLESHFAESYFVPSLLVNAWQDSTRHSIVSQNCLAMWQNGTISTAGNWERIGIDQLKKILYVYLCKQFGLIAR